MSSIVSSILIAAGVITSPLAIKFHWIIVPGSVPKWILLFSSPIIIFLVLAIIAGVRLQFTIDSQYGRVYRVLEALAGLREEGTTLWIEGMEIHDKSDVIDWIDRIRDWQSRVTDQITILSGVEARLFQTLRYFSAPTLRDPINFNHNLNYRMLHRRLEIIEELIRRFSPR